MADETDDQAHTATSDTPAQILESRVAAMERALASLGDAVCPGGGAHLEPYYAWRKSLGS